MCQCGLTKIIFLNVRWEKFLKQMRWLGCPQTCLVGVELQRNGQPIFCRPKVSLKVKSLDVLLSVLRLHGRLLGLLITSPHWPAVGELELQSFAACRTKLTNCPRRT